MDYLRESFQKVKQDILFLQNQIDILNNNNQKITEQIKEIKDIFLEMNQKLTQITPTNNQKNPTDLINSPTDNNLLKGLKPVNLGISIGNDGVPTNKQTNQQTDQQTENAQKIGPLSSNNPLKSPDTFDDAIKIIESLDNIKKDLRFKFKKLTDQELLVFSTIYQLEEEFGYTDYKTIAKKLNLTESSIRDYTRKLLKKGISIEKIKINNKNIHLIISKNLKKIASLKTILQLRDL